MGPGSHGVWSPANGLGHFSEWPCTAINDITNAHPLDPK